MRFRNCPHCGVPMKLLSKECMLCYCENNKCKYTKKDMYGCYAEHYGDYYEEEGGKKL